MRRKGWVLLLLAGVGLTLAVGFILIMGVPFSYDGAVRSGRNAIPYARQFDSLFPKSDHFISYFTGTYGPPTWNSETVMYGRYELMMQMPVQINGLRNRIASYGQPQFILNEIESVTGSPVAGGSVKYGGHQVQFGATEWKKLVQSGGDLRVLGFTPVKDDPIRGAGQFLTGNQ